MEQRCGDNLMIMCQTLCLKSLRLLCNIAFDTYNNLTHLITLDSYNFSYGFIKTDYIYQLLERQSEPSNEVHAELAYIAFWKCKQ